MSGKSKLLRANALEWTPQQTVEPSAEEDLLVAEPPLVNQVTEEPVSTRFRFTDHSLNMSHASTTCDTEGYSFSTKVNDFLRASDQESAKLKIEYCRDARIQETIGYEYSCATHLKLIDLHINLREAYEPPLPPGTTLSYVNMPGANPPQYYLIQSPIAIPEAPWYGAKEVKITNKDIEITENPENSPYTHMLSRYNAPQRLVNLTWIRYNGMSQGLNYIDPNKHTNSCFFKQQYALEQEYNQAVFDSNLFYAANPSPPLPPATGGRRKYTKRNLHKKRKATRKIGRGRSRKI
jgi:hypothetical protein